jgi:hypothetical protein
MIVNQLLLSPVGGCNNAVGLGLYKANKEASQGLSPLTSYENEPPHRFQEQTDDNDKSREIG